MSWLRNCWYQVGWSSEVRAGEPLTRTILEEPILLYRTNAGDTIALQDRCPHRFAPLSAGRIEKDVAVCGYHGLAFGADGACVRNPHGPITAKMRVKTYPVVERHTAVWIWMGEPDDADESTVPDLSFIDETRDTARITGYMPTRCNYRLLTDNIMDLSHADYLHPTTLGGMMTSADAGCRVDGDRVVAEWIANDCVPPPAFRSMIPEGANADIRIEVVWSPPAVMVLGVEANAAGAPRNPDNGGYTLHSMTPETARSTHYFYCSTRRFLPDDEKLSAFLRQSFTQAFENEDKPMLEKQQASMGDADFWELSPVLLSVDAAAVQARRKLDKLIAAE